MLKLFAFLFRTFPLILSWLYLMVAIFALVVHIRQIKKKSKITISQWLFTLLNCAYIASFLITLIFFFSVWETVFSIVGVMAIIVSFCWSRYDDMRHGRRWWTW